MVTLCAIWSVFLSDPMALGPPSCLTRPPYVMRTVTSYHVMTPIDPCPKLSSHEPQQAPPDLLTIAALLILYRHVRSHGRVPRNFPRAARRATVYAFLLSLPWSAVAVLYLGSLPQDKELVLVALVVGMAASGTILLSALPFAAFAYMSGSGFG